MKLKNYLYKQVLKFFFRREGDHYPLKDTKRLSRGSDHSRGPPVSSHRRGRQRDRSDPSVSRVGLP